MSAERQHKGRQHRGIATYGHGTRDCQMISDADALQTRYPRASHDGYLVHEQAAKLEKKLRWGVPTADIVNQ